jgi:hypothetical protein
MNHWNIARVASLTTVIAFLPGCTGPRSQDQTGTPVKSGNPVRDAFEADLFALRAGHAAKEKVLEALGGEVRQILDASMLETLPHAEESTVTMSREVLSAWKRQFARSSETLYVLAEDGNDILLFFDSASRLTDYVHM